MPKYLVETVSVFRMRYVVEAKTASDARDEVTARLPAKVVFPVIVDLAVLSKFKLLADIFKFPLIGAVILDKLPPSMKIFPVTRKLL
jgi:hypothetical protein